jgi:hypothetical protein
MTVDLSRSSRATRQGRDLLLVRWRHRQGREGGTAKSPIVHWCSEQGMLRWMHQLLLQRMHPWTHRDGTGPEIVEGGPCQGAPVVIAAVVFGAARAVVLAFPLPLAFPAIVGVGGRRVRGCLRTRRPLLRWARRQLLLQRAPFT